jgi:hypothetical protein
MNRKPRIAIALIYLLFACVAASAAEQQVAELHGFRVEYAKVIESDWQRMQPSLARQFEIVEAAGVPPAVLEFFKTVPIVIVRTLKTGYGHAGMEAGRQIVELKSAKLPTDRPILLHELLHAYHGQKLGRSPAILQAYEQAVKSGMYPKKYANAHFLENPREYFAVIGSIFLFGEKLDQPPFDCRIAAQRQPEFIAFLEKNFGPHTCK